MRMRTECWEGINLPWQHFPLLFQCFSLFMFSTPIMHEGISHACKIMMFLFVIFAYEGRRRRKEGGFPGSSTILTQLKEKPARRRVGLVSLDGPPARAGAVVVGGEGKVVGHVTSGCPSPCLKMNIAMAYVPQTLSKPGLTPKLRIRTRTVQAEITKMPFVPHKYFFQ